MAKKGARNYNSGKKQEKEADVYMKSRGFTRPGAKQRKVVQEALLKTKGAEINTTGFDLVATEVIPYCDDVDVLVSCITQSELGDQSVPSLVLYEMKSAGSKRKTKVSENWKNFGFTISENEENNWVEVGDDGYKFLFVDMSSTPVRYRVLNRAEWDNSENCRSYTTKSIFIKGL